MKFYETSEPLAAAKQMCVMGDVRISVLMPDLIRVEKAAGGKFTDFRTLSVWNRRFGECDYEAEEVGKTIVVRTEKAVFRIKRRSGKTFAVEKDGKYIDPIREKSMPGTARTLDFTMGNARLSGSVVSRSGVAVLRDASLAIDTNGDFAERAATVNDEYVFASDSPSRALELLYALTGAPPLIPRKAFGNWWSRYYPYSSDEFLALTDGFCAADVPFTVAVIDMDWHWTDPGRRFGYRSFEGAYMLKKGWTGYTWNSELFPDHRAFLKALHARGMMTGLNLHPAGGVRSFEAQYAEAARRAGVKDGKRVPFDPVSRKAWKDYFEVLMHPYEKDGVDFWWIDWQQGRRSGMRELDPLWALNHYHYTDSCKNSARGMILSRYSGIGSHRYPVGFSGDSIICWRSLKFQPYFTASASNVGYTCWSHDIGGHTLGNPADDELYLRWIQYGVFSPILRLHSSDAVRSKEPSNHPSVKKEAEDALRFRMRLIPYLYSAYYFNYSESVPPIQPMYYRNGESEAYEYTNEFYFGSELVVAPVTVKCDKRTGLAKTRVWLPEGRWKDIHTGETREGGSFVALRGKASIPVYLKEGGILPLAEKERRDAENPVTIELVLNPGNGVFRLFEDDGVSEKYTEGDGAVTVITASYEQGRLSLTVEESGNRRYIPEGRKFVATVPGEKWRIAEVRRGSAANGAFAAVNGVAEVILEKEDVAGQTVAGKA